MLMCQCGNSGCLEAMTSGGAQAREGLFLATEGRAPADAVAAGGSR